MNKSNVLILDNFYISSLILFPFTEAIIFRQALSTQNTDMHLSIGICDCQNKIMLSVYINGYDIKSFAFFVILNVQGHHHHHPHMC